MATSSRSPARSESTRIALVEAAEALFAEEGFDKVSVRQIGAAIGSANNGIIAYYFGSKDALVDAIYDYRMPSIEARREQLWRDAQARGQGEDFLSLVMAVWLPLYEQVNAAGQHSYARFLGMEFRKGMGTLRRMVHTSYPVTRDLARHIQALRPLEHGDEWNMRWLIATRMIINALEFIDNMQSDGADASRRLFNTAVSMAAASLTVPMADELA